MAPVDNNSYVIMAFKKCCCIGQTKTMGKQY